jgi:Domain of unknown function (DUF6968)
LCDVPLEASGLHFSCQDEVRMSEGTDATPLGAIVASRRYFRPPTEGGEYIAEVAIGRPVPSPTSELEFVCPFRITIKDQELIRIARGIDELHALLMAFAYVDGAMQVLRESLNGAICYPGGAVGELGLQIPDIQGMIENQ